MSRRGSRLVARDRLARGRGYCCWAVGSGGWRYCIVSGQQLKGPCQSLRPVSGLDSVIDIVDVSHASQAWVRELIAETAADEKASDQRPGASPFGGRASRVMPIEERTFITVANSGFPPWLRER